MLLICMLVVNVFPNLKCCTEFATRRNQVISRLDAIVEIAAAKSLANLHFDLE